MINMCKTDFYKIDDTKMTMITLWMLLVKHNTRVFHSPIFVRHTVLQY